MTSGNSKNESGIGWLTVEEAAALLKMTPRNVNLLGNRGKLRTTRVGRRVLYRSDDVAKLADEMQVTLKPQQITKSEATEQIVQYIRERAATDKELREAQWQIEKQLRENAERLERIEQRIPQPFEVSKWYFIALLMLLLVIAIGVLLLALRVF